MSDTAPLHKAIRGILDLLPVKQKFMPVHGVAIISLLAVNVDGHPVPQTNIVSNLPTEACAVALIQVLAKLVPGIVITIPEPADVVLQPVEGEGTDEQKRFISHEDHLKQTQEGIDAALIEDHLKGETVQ